MSRPPRLPPGFRLIALERCGSTNEEARRLAEEGAEEGTLVWAREQTAGRGRRGRKWRSPRGNLYLSLVLRPRAAPAEAACLGMVAAVAVGDALGAFMPPLTEVRFKWPNDVLVGGGKVGGVLLESGAQGPGRLAWVILGIGINIESCPDDTPFPATCLEREAGAKLELETVLEAVSRSLRRWLHIWREEGFQPAREAWLARAWKRGEVIEVRLEDETLAGLFEGLDASGALLLALENGRHRRVSAGDVMEASVRT